MAAIKKKLRKRPRNFTDLPRRQSSEERKQIISLANVCACNCGITSSLLVKVFGEQDNSHKNEESPLHFLSNEINPAIDVNLDTGANSFVITFKEPFYRDYEEEIKRKERIQRVQNSY